MTSRSLKLLGIGAAASSALGVYLYKHPKLRKQMRKADTVRDAAGILTSQLSHDSADVAKEMVAGMTNGVVEGLSRTRKALGKRFFPAQEKMTPVKAGIKHVKNEVKHMARAAKTEASHARQIAANEISRVKDEAMEARDLLAAQQSK